MMTPQTILKFWFEETDQKFWFAKDLNFDAQLKEKFGKLLESAAKGELVTWRETLEGRLAEIIVLDQFSRNIYRDAPQSFAQDTMALVLSQEAIKDPRHLELSPPKKAFLYMPFMHSESLKMHEKAVELYSQKGLEFNLDFEKKHKKIIEQFGRFPHRNQILGRTSTAAEIEFLKTNPGF